MTWVQLILKDQRWARMLAVVGRRFLRRHNDGPISFRYCLGVWLLLAPGTSWAQVVGQDFVASIGNIGLLAPPDPPPPGGPKIYASTGPTPNWNVAQWNIPGGELSPFTSEEAGGALVQTASAAEAQVHIIRRGRDVQVILAQDGTVLPCESAGRPRESDLLLSPNGRSVTKPGISGLALQGAANLPLTGLSRLEFSADVAVAAGITEYRKGCPVDQGGATIGLVLSQKDVAHPQTMFYQLHIDEICGIQPAARDRICHATHSQLQYFFRTNPFGADDFLPLNHQPYLHNGEDRALRLDLLPRLKLIIAQSPPAADHDLSHWYVGGIYVGQAIWGDVTLRSSWSHVHLVAIPQS
jgi:hypothetical protein